jgi:uncharacterized Zn finger protein (UPF0148 family)
MNLLSRLQEELVKRQNTISCPNCGVSLVLIKETAQLSKARRKPGITSRSTPKRASGVTVKGMAVSRKRRAAPSELVRLAMQYAKQKHNGRIGDAYRDVKNGIAKEAKGKRPDEIKALKIKWFRNHTSRS